MQKMFMFLSFLFQISYLYCSPYPIIQKSKNDLTNPLSHQITVDYIKQHSNHSFCELSESVTLTREPLLADMETQDDYGVCYATAFLSNLHYNVEQERVFSLSDTIIMSNNTRYKEGGNALGVALKLASKGTLFLKKDEPFSHDVLVGLCNEFKKRHINKAKKAIVTSFKNKENKQRTQLLPFTIHKIDLQNHLLENIITTLKNDHMVLTSIIAHVVNIYGINSYRCTNGEKEEIIKTIKILDPNGFKIEALADDFLPFIQNAFFLKKSKTKKEIFYKGQDYIQQISMTDDINVLNNYIKKYNINLKDDSILSDLLINSGKNLFKYLSQFKNTDFLNLVKSKEKGYGLLEKAILDEDMGYLKFLLKQDLDVNVRDANGCTPLDVAIIGENKKAIELLLLFDADVNLQDPVTGKTPLHRLAESKLLGQCPFLCLFPENTRTDIKDFLGETALEMATKNQNTPIIELIEELNKKDTERP